MLDIGWRKIEFKQVMTVGDRSKLIEIQNRCRGIEDWGIQQSCEVFALLCATIDWQVMQYDEKLNFIQWLTDLSVYMDLVKECNNLQDRINLELEEKKKTLNTSVKDEKQQNQ